MQKIYYSLYRKETTDEKANYSCKQIIATIRESVMLDKRTEYSFRKQDTYTHMT